MKKASILFPIFKPKQAVEAAVDCLKNQTCDDWEIIFLQQVEPESLQTDVVNKLASLPSAKVVDGTYQNIAQMMNRGFKEASGDVVIYLPPNIESKPDMVAEYLSVFRDNPKTGMAFADFAEVYPDGKTEIKKLRDYDGDITERGNYGYARAYLKSAVKAVGGYDQLFNSAEEYDLRLKLSEKFDLVHVPKVLYDLCISPEKAEEKAANVGASKLFFPGEGKYGGFSYLFYDKDQEREIEEAFYAYLKRQGAYLDHRNAEIKYEGDEDCPVLATVVIPVYNREKFIGRALDSVLRNDFDSFEVIVIDNGSTDNTIEVVESYVNQPNSKIRLIKNDKNIIAYSLNLGIKASRGKYISQLDSDDEYTPHTLRKMTDHLESHPNCALAISYYDLIDEDGNPLEEFGIIKHLEYNRNNILRVDGAGALRMWRKKVMEEYGLFNEDKYGHYGEDYDLVLKVSEKYDIDRVHEVCYHYRRHSDNTDIKRDPELKIYNKTRARQEALVRRKKLN